MWSHAADTSDESNDDYKEKDGGARLEEMRDGAEMTSLAWGIGINATGLRSARINTTSLSIAVPAAHIQEQSSVPCVAD